MDKIDKPQNPADKANADKPDELTILRERIKQLEANKPTLDQPKKALSPAMDSTKSSSKPLIPPMATGAGKPQETTKQHADKTSLELPILTSATSTKKIVKNENTINKINSIAAKNAKNMSHQEIKARTTTIDNFKLGSKVPQKLGVSPAGKYLKILMISVLLGVFYVGFVGAYSLYVRSSGLEKMITTLVEKAFVVSAKFNPENSGWKTFPFTYRLGTVSYISVGKQVQAEVGFKLSFFNFDNYFSPRGAMVFSGLDIYIFEKEEVFRELLKLLDFMLETNNINVEIENSRFFGHDQLMVIDNFFIKKNFHNDSYTVGIAGNNNEQYSFDHRFEASRIGNILEFSDVEIGITDFAWQNFGKINFHAAVEKVVVEGGGILKSVSPFMGKIVGEKLSLAFLSKEFSYVPGHLDSLRFLETELDGKLGGTRFAGIFGVFNNASKHQFSDISDFKVGFAGDLVEFSGNELGIQGSSLFSSRLEFKSAFGSGNISEMVLEAGAGLRGVVASENFDFFNFVSRYSPLAISENELYKLDGNLLLGNDELFFLNSSIKGKGLDVSSSDLKFFQDKIDLHLNGNLVDLDAFKLWSFFEIGIYEKLLYFWTENFGGFYKQLVPFKLGVSTLSEVKFLGETFKTGAMNIEVNGLESLAFRKFHLGVDAKFLDIKGKVENNIDIFSADSSHIAMDIDAKNLNLANFFKSQYGITGNSQFSFNGSLDTFGKPISWLANLNAKGSLTLNGFALAENNISKNICNSLVYYGFANKAKSTTNKPLSIKGDMVVNSGLLGLKVDTSFDGFRARGDLKFGLANGEAKLVGKLDVGANIQGCALQRYASLQMPMVCEGFASENMDNLCKVDYNANSRHKKKHTADEFIFEDALKELKKPEPTPAPKSNLKKTEASTATKAEKPKATTPPNPRTNQGYIPQ